MIDHMPRYERIWLMLGLSSLVLFLIILGVMAVGLGLRPPGHTSTIVPESAATTAPFDQPGVTQIGPGEYRAVILAQMFMYAPNELQFPKGAKVHFQVTSADVVHGLFIPKTNVNIMAVPGQITEFTYTFKQAGSYLVLCHEYCGAGHQVMMGKMEVLA